MKGKVRTAVLIALAILMLLAAQLIWSTAGPFESGQTLLTQNYAMYSTLAGFMMDLTCPDARIGSTDEPYDAVFVYDPDSTPASSPFYYEDESIEALFRSCFQSRKSQIITKKEGCVIFQIWSTLDTGSGILYIAAPPVSDRLMIDGECYIISALDEPGWFSYDCGWPHKGFGQPEQ